MTYTEHKLTDAQLRRLSVIVNNAKGARAGMAAIALERKGLIGYSEIAVQGRRLIEATDAGIAALAQARAEGW